MGACALAAEEGQWSSELRLGVVDEPFGGVVAVCWCGGEGVLGCSSVADGDAEDAGGVGDVL